MSSAAARQHNAALVGTSKLNESVWELYNYNQAEVPTVEVIFFHGLQMGDYRNAFWETWLSRYDETNLWPKEWLGPALQGARIVSVSYDASAQTAENHGAMEPYQIVENLLRDVVLSATYVINERSTIILVGHSLGGLIIKQLLLKVRSRQSLLGSENRENREELRQLTTFLNNCRGIFYYATPHSGSRLPEYAKVADHVPFAELNMPIINFLRVFSNETARINDEFALLRRSVLKVRTEAIAELYKTEFAGRNEVVVPEASARHDVDSYYTARANHFDVCRPEDQESSSIFLQLRDLCGRWTTVLSPAFELC